MDSKIVAVKGYEGRYSITPQGRVISHLQRKDSTDVSGDYPLTTHLTYDGYVAVMLYDGEGHCNRQRIHRLVCQAFNGPGTARRNQVNHKDGNKSNNAPENLEWVTASENCLHAHRTGLAPSQAGTSNGNAKLDADKVRAIRQGRKDGRTLVELAREFGCHLSNISLICLGKKWAHVV